MPAPILTSAELVRRAKDGLPLPGDELMSMNRWILIEGLQGLAKALREAEARVAALEAEVASLTAEVATLGDVGGQLVERILGASSGARGHATPDGGQRLMDWIAVEERLPEPDYPDIVYAVLVTVETRSNGERWVAIAFCCDGQWRFDECGEVGDRVESSAYRVVGWQSLPRPMREKKES